ncbi:MAG TPA: rhodanese-like domain-containing protein [Halomicronema sp.]
MSNISDAISQAKEALPDITPTPPKFKPQSSAHDLKSRLEWGEPGLTILDVRERGVFNQGRIMGAMSMPLNEVVERAQSSLEPIRDIYVYGENDEQTAQAAGMLRSAGFLNVAELRGGLEAWKAIAGSTEGINEDRQPPSPSAYNTAAQIKHHADTQSRDV